jgi:superfamily II RNA helicase
VACRLRSSELVLWEILSADPYRSIFADLTPSKAAALLSCFVFDDKIAEGKVSAEMGGLMRKLQVGCIDL